MSKYIDIDKLIAEIERRIDLICTTEGVVQRDRLQEYETLRDIEDFIASIQQEQSVGEEYAIEIGKNVHTFHVGSQSDIGHSIRQKKQEQQEQDKSYCKAHCKGYKDTGGKCFFDWQCSKIKKQEQPEMNLEKEIHKKVLELRTAPCYDELASFAYHFYELGLNARKEE